MQLRRARCMQGGCGMRIALVLCLAACSTTHHWQAPHEPGYPTLICMNTCKADVEDCAKKCGPGVRVEKGPCADPTDTTCEEYKKRHPAVAIASSVALTTVLGGVLVLYALTSGAEALQPDPDRH